MKKLFDSVINFGISEVLLPHDRRKIKTVNFLNVICACFLIIGYSNYFILGSNFAAGPVSLFLVLTLLSLVLSKLHMPGASFVLFSLNVNASIFYLNQQYPLEVGAYLFYFPLIVSVVLLNNPTFKDKYFLFHSLICAVGFSLSMFVKVRFIEVKTLSAEEIKVMWYYDMFISAIITATLSFLLNRLILQQSNEILTQNKDLTVAKEEVNVSLKEKEILLAELHHRVKNNLAIISGLLNLQDDATSNEEAKEIIGDSKARIMSMALVHRMLYENTELKNLDLGQYASELILELFNSYNLARKVQITQEYDTIILPIAKSIPLGLILNEIVTNSIKYAYRSASPEKGNFYVSIRENNNHVTVTIQDNGPGFPESFNPEAENLSLGVFLIKTLTEQIDGKVAFMTRGGARIELNFDLN
ncbi:MAG: sensor histidine kinase [bacterium]|nr:sensor histidine kinase [bacterium]